VWRRHDLKIAFESQLLLKGNKTGIAWYADNIVRELAQNPHNVCQCNFFSVGYSEEQLKIMKAYENVGIKLNPCNKLNYLVYKLIWPIIHVPYSWFFGGENDVTVFFNYVIPPGVKGRKALYIYDLAHLAYPSTVRFRTRIWFKIVLKKSCQRADMIFTISEFSKKEIVERMNIPEDRIRVISCGVDAKKFENRYSQEEVKQVKAKYNLADNYFLYLGTIEPRKNVINLLKAYYELQKSENTSRNIPKLVLAGVKGWKCKDVYEFVNTHNLQEKVIFVGYVEEHEKVILLNAAIGFVFISWYEGFGIPPLEAMASGTPVMISNRSALPEVVGDAAIIVDPERIDEITAGLKLMMYNREFCDALVTKARERVPLYSWQRSGAIIVKALEELVR